jgi:hypothetical protein
MDDIVKQAIAKWPNVPDCYGWLALDARGNWYLRDDAAQAAGPFQSGAPPHEAADGASAESSHRRAAAKGSRLLHEKLVDFIQRNYEGDAQGRWFFQNGPQRVYVELEITPWVWRVAPGPRFEVAAHTGAMAQSIACFLDEHGRVYLQTDIGFGLVHSLDMTHAADAIEQGLWMPDEVQSADLPRRFAFVVSPEQEKRLVKAIH